LHRRKSHIYNGFVDEAPSRGHIERMSFDISNLLEQWDYQPGLVVARRFMGGDGHEKIQLRVDLGILQMNAQGRPDGKHPFGYPSIYDYFINRLSHYTRKHEGSDDGFVLKPEDVAKLQLEALQYHHRSICFMQLEDYAAVVQDTERVLHILDFIAEHADSDDLAMSLQQFRPQVMMLQTRAQATQKLAVEDYRAAISIIEQSLEQFREFFNAVDRPEMADQSMEVQSLLQWLDEVKRKRPVSKRERLEMDLDEAVQNEDYEKAAKVRDALKNLKAD
jgi:hypothetical protein